MDYFLIDIFLLQSAKQVIKLSIVSHCIKYSKNRDFHKLVKLILDKITLDVLITFQTKTCFLVHVTCEIKGRGRRKKYPNMNYGF